MHREGQKYMDMKFEYIFKIKNEEPFWYPLNGYYDGLSNSDEIYCGFVGLHVWDFFTPKTWSERY